MSGILEVANGKLIGNTAFVAWLGRKYSSGLEPWTVLRETGGEQWPTILNVHEDVYIIYRWTDITARKI